MIKVHCKKLQCKSALNFIGCKIQMKFLHQLITIHCKRNKIAHTFHWKIPIRFFDKITKNILQCIVLIVFVNIQSIGD